jgi:membrane protein
MRDRPPSFGSDLALIAGTILATLAVHRHLTQSALLRVAADNTRLEPHHGRFAQTPLQIPFAGWKDILLRTYQQINEDRLLATAGGVVFYGLLVVFPAITALVI